MNVSLEQFFAEIIAFLKDFFAALQAFIAGTKPSWDFPGKDDTTI